MTANINPDTGIAYGYISANALNPEVVDELLYGKQAYIISDDEQAYIVSGNLEGVHYLSSWLGGGLHFLITFSTHITDKARLASPCVLNAGILDTLDGSVKAYDVPPDWRQER